VHHLKVGAGRTPSPSSDLKSPNVSKPSNGVTLANIAVPLRRFWQVDQIGLQIGRFLDSNPSGKLRQADADDGLTHVLAYDRQRLVGRCRFRNE
jgi:hypothetical protein